MPSMLSKLFLAAGICLGACATAAAAPFVATFTMGGFGNGSPVETVSGSIGWDADSLFGPINRITDVNLSILGHEYSVDELQVLTQTSLPGEFPWNTVIISGKLNDTDTGAVIETGTDDFWLRWHRDTNEWIDFVYATGGVAGIWSAGEPQLAIAPAPVPEPATWTLLLAALGLFGGRRMMRCRH